MLVGLTATVTFPLNPHPPPLDSVINRDYPSEPWCCSSISICRKETWLWQNKKTLQQAKYDLAHLFGSGGGYGQIE